MRTFQALKGELEGIAARPADGHECFKSVVRAVVKAVVQGLSVYEDEVAIFLPSGDGATFRFAAPLPLFDDGSTFPARNSLTQKVYGSAVPLINNNVKIQKPLSIYERAKISDRNPRPIQKMLAVPIMDGAYKVGVLQVSRRGLAVREAGPDFGPSDQEALSTIARLAAPHLRSTCPDEF